MKALSGEAQEAQARLLRRYFSSLPEKRARIEECTLQLELTDWSDVAVGKLRMEVHRLAGSAGNYGLEALGHPQSIWKFC